MMGSNWRDCIIIFIDLVGVKKLAAKNGAGSKLMQKLYSLAVTNLPQLTSVSRAYVWNDSILLLSYIGNSSDSFVAIMKDADKFKRHVDTLMSSYAIAVKGQTFPSLRKQGRSPANVTFLEASSWAMANCFEIERRLKKLRASWYVDGRIANKLRGTTRSTKHKVQLYPSGQSRAVHSYKDYLWE
ncbi:MAG: hypothetical protein HYY49_05090 [Ignavibacteriales bacterium]|nr:hypothetical protein [Ignavibacteriales bacterium]